MSLLEYNSTLTSPGDVKRGRKVYVWAINPHYTSKIFIKLQIFYDLLLILMGFLVGSLGRVCLQCGGPGFNPWVRKIPWRRKWQPTPVFLPGEFYEQRSLVGYSPWGHKELDTTEWLTLWYWMNIHQFNVHEIRRIVMLLKHKRISIMK